VTGALAREWRSELTFEANYSGQTINISDGRSLRSRDGEEQVERMEEASGERISVDSLSAPESRNWSNKKGRCVSTQSSRSDTAQRAAESQTSEDVLDPKPFNEHQTRV